MPLARNIQITGVPIQGGAITVREEALLKPGQFSMVQNVKPTRPGFAKRAGQRKLHSTADGTNQAMSAYQFKKTRISESKYFVQMSDGDVLELTNSPPTVTTGAMGSEAFDGTTAPIPASWANLNDVLVFSNGVDSHKLYPGATSYVDRFIVYTTYVGDIAAYKGILDEGVDYTEEVTDGQSTTVAVLDSLDDKDAGDGIFICTQYPAKSFTFTVSAGNDNAATMAVYYWKNTTAWATVAGLSDGTATGDDMLYKTGTVTFTPPTDIQERYLFGRVGYWYLIVSTANALDAEVEISRVTYDAAWHSLQAHWDGSPVYAVQVLVEGTSQYDTYAGESVDLDTLAVGKKIYICSADPIEGIYVDPGSTPNATGTTITTLKYWTGTAWAAVTVADDGSAGLSNAGWIIFNRAAAQPRHFETSKIRAYWYELILSAELAADTQIAVYCMPYYDIHDYGYVGQASCVWKERVLWTFADRFQEYVYITVPDNPQVLSSDDSAIIQVGDGRPHKVVAIKNFFNNVLVYQEEKGSAGGCITMLQGYSKPTFGKLVLSTKVGGMNAKAIDVVENVYTATATDEELKTVAFSLSRYGVVACDGTSIAIISDDIQNYFDPTKTECIRAGYENQMWLKHDPVDHVVRIGLVSGATATVPNIFPVYDLIDRVWYFDVRGQALSFLENVDAGSGQTPFVQIAGGTADGTLYQLNYGTADVSTAIDSYVRIELNGRGHYLALLQFMIQCLAATGNITLTTYQNGIQKDLLTLSMTAEVTNQQIRRHLLSMNVVDQHIAVKIQNSSTTETMTILNTGVEARIWVNR